MTSRQNPVITDSKEIDLTHLDENNLQSCLPGSLCVEIQPKGTRTPLFLVHGVGGGMLWGYINLAQHMGADQPVYAIKSADIGKLIELETVEKMADHYVKELRRFRPEGPYLLGGYCFGGNIAVEMARQLVLQGQRVNLVALINSSPPNSSYDSIGYSPSYAYKFLKNLRYWIEGFISWDSEKKMRFLHWKATALKRRCFSLLRLGRDCNTNGINVDNLVDLSLMHNDRRLWEVHLKALLTHATKPYGGNVLLLRTRGHPFNCSYDPDCGWKEFITGDIVVRTLAGLHEGLLEEPYAGECARELKFYAAAAQVQNLDAHIRQLTRADLPAVAAIHKAAFPQAAISRFGTDAAKRYYETLMTGPYTVAGFGVFDADVLLGYGFVGPRHTAVRIYVLRNLCYLMGCLLMHPWMLADTFILSRAISAVQLTLGIFRAKTGDGTPSKNQNAYAMQYIAVHPSYRGRGLSKLLLSTCVELARLEESDGIYLSVYLDNARAIHIYECMGWRRADGRDTSVRPTDEEWRGFMFRPTANQDSLTAAPVAVPRVEYVSK